MIDFPSMGCNRLNHSISASDRGHGDGDGVCIWGRANPSVADLVSLKNQRIDARISVCVPCRNEASTIGSIVSSARAALVDTKYPLVDEIVVMDDRSVDATAEVARRAGARVVHVADVLPNEPRGVGKGNALWASVAASTGDIIVWCDGDLTSFTPRYIERLVTPFLVDPSTAFVKGFYERPVDAAGEGGGRNTELVARPLFSLFFPELASIRQPLGGEYAATRAVLEQLPFAMGYGVEVGLLIDSWRLVGSQRMVQVDLGVRRHRHQPLLDLAAQALEIQHAILQRAGVDPVLLADAPTLLQPGRDPKIVNVGERSPLLHSAEYLNR
jgi:glucosyl-3-phosphoglycerate synthase